MLEFMTLMKALADENRLRALIALRDRELCVCQIVELLRLAPSTVSKHMAILKQARLVESRKDGRWTYYRIAGGKMPPAAREAVDWIGRSLADNSQITADTQRLAGILDIDREQLCRQQAESGRPLLHLGSVEENAESRAAPISEQDA